MDNNIEDPGAVFTIPDLWGPPRCLQISQDQSSLLFSQLKIADIDEAVPNTFEQTKPNEGFFSIPDLSFGPAGDVPQATQSTEPVGDAVVVLEEGHEDYVDDFWILKEEEPLKEACYQSWDAFDDKGAKELYTPYITEAGPAIFNASIADPEDNLRIGNASHLVVDSRTYSSSLLALGLGRSSIFFAWSEEKQSFEQTLPQIRVTGYSGDSLQGLVTIFKECGSITKYLQRYVDRTYVKTKSAGQVALADAISTLLTTIQTRLSTSASTHQSLLQLQTLFLPAHSVLTCFYRITKNVSSAKTDEAMLSIIFEETQLLEHRTDSLRDILLQILIRVSKPWLEFSGEWLGLQRESGLPVTKEGTGKNFVKVEDKEWIDEQGFELQESDYALNYDMIPSFIAPDDARSMFEVGRSLRFLRTHHTEHPLAKMDIVASAQPPALEWKFSWQDVMQVEAKALQYEKDLKAAIQQFSTDPFDVRVLAAENNVGKTFELNFFGKPEEDMKAYVLASIDAFESPLSDNTSPDELSQVLTTYLSSTEGVTNDDSIFAPPISLAPVLSFNPIISTQARIINNACIRLFFDSHKLREHLSVQRSFHLLGNGVFSSRLSHALFDPELETAERQRGIARSGGVMGLRLEGRENWPPASSELRLALMGVLTESYVSSQSLNQSRVGGYIDRSPTLPGDLSFAVRDMSPEEIDACMDPNSVEALDFLRLSYKPPAPLEAVITPIILYKYDQLFKLLLRVIRMLYVVSALFRDAAHRTSHWQGIDYVAQRFRIEAQHFVSSISGYFFDTGIEATWQVFESKLDQVEERIHSKDSNVTFGHNEGLDKLRDYHERVLDRIMFALFLRKRQQPILKLLEEIFTLILQFAKHSRETALAVKRDVPAGDEVREMYRKFRKKVGVFITVCKSLSEKKGYGEKRSMEGQSMGQGGLFDGHDLAEENTIVQLLTRLEMSDYYSKAVRV